MQPMKQFSILLLAVALAYQPSVSAVQPTTEMKKQALYHQPGKDPKPFEILNEHPDGTVDLGIHDTLVVSRCPLSTVALPGTATLADGKAIPTSAIPHAELVESLEAAGKEIERQRGVIDALTQENEKLRGEQSKEPLDALKSAAVAKDSSPKPKGGSA